MVCFRETRARQTPGTAGRGGIEVYTGGMDRVERERPAPFKDYFEHADIVTLGETSGHGNHTETIAAFLDTYGHTLSGICLELSRDLQADVDIYLADGMVTKRLQGLFDGAAEEGKPRVRKMILSALSFARKTGLSVMCYDAAKSNPDGSLAQADKRGGHWFIRGECRDEDMFEYIKAMHAKRPGKYLVVIGGDHLSDANREGPYKNFGRRMREQYGSLYKAVRLTHSNEPLPSSFSQDAFDDILTD